MENKQDGPIEKRDAGKDDITEATPNSDKKSAVETSNAGDDDNSRNYMNKAGKEYEGGPDFDKKSKAVDGDSGENAGIFK